MDYFRQALSIVRSGAWLTRDRARGYCLILIAFYVIASAIWIALSSTGIDPNGKPLGTDFASFYAAGSLARDGYAAAAYDMAAHFARQQQIFGASTPYYAWFYPPLFLLIAAPLAMMPYALALTLWQVTTLMAYLASIVAITRRVTADRDLRRLAFLAALAFPAVFINLGHGQNGFLTAALFGGALVSIDRRPITAGILFGLLAYKPQFALVIPIALVAAGQWRTIASAAVSVALLGAVTTWLFDIDIWTAFASSTAVSRKLLLEDGEVGFAKLQSVFAAARMWHAGIGAAYVAQGLATFAATVAAAWVWRTSDDLDLKAAALIVATLFASPHILDYDLMMTAPAIAFLIAAGLRTGFRPYEITILAAAWAIPLVTRGIATATSMPVGLVTIVAVFVMIIRRAIATREAKPLHAFATA